MLHHQWKGITKWLRYCMTKWTTQFPLLFSKIYSKLLRSFIPLHWFIQMQATTKIIDPSGSQWIQGGQARYQMWSQIWPTPAHPTRPTRARYNLIWYTTCPRWIQSITMRPYSLDPIVIIEFFESVPYGPIVTQLSITLLKFTTIIVNYIIKIPT